MPKADLGQLIYCHTVVSDRAKAVTIGLLLPLTCSHLAAAAAIVAAKSTTLIKPHTSWPPLINFLLSRTHANN